MASLDSFRCCKTLKVGNKTYAFYSLEAAEKNGLKGISRLPVSMKVLLENLLRNEDGRSVTTIRKNSTPITAPPPTRMASRMSRISRADRAFMAASFRGRT